MVAKSRYLLCCDFIPKKKSFLYTKKSEQEFYTYVSRCKTIKYKAVDNHFFKVVKTQKGYKEISISKEQFKKKSLKRLSNIVFKSLYFIEDDIKLIEYTNGYDGLKILEVPSGTDISRFQSSILEDITDQKIYSDVSLALYGNPTNDDKNIHKIMKKIKNMENIDMQNIIKKDMPLDSAIRLKLYELFIKLENERFEILNHDLNRANILTKYRKRLFTIINILKEYSFCFDEDLVKKVEENLLYIYNKTDIDKELYSIKENLKRYKKCLSSEDFLVFLQDKDGYISDEVEKFSYFIQTREYSIILKQLELLIRESSIELDDRESKDFTIKSAVKKSLKKGFKKLRKIIKKYIDCEDEYSFNKIQNKIFKLKTINNEFGFLTGEKAFHKRKKILLLLEADVDKSLKNIRNITIAKSTIKDAVDVECLVKKFEKQKVEAIDSLKKNIKLLKKNSEFFIS